MVCQPERPEASAEKMVSWARGQRLQDAVQSAWTQRPVGQGGGAEGAGAQGPERNAWWTCSCPLLGPLPTLPGGPNPTATTRPCLLTSLRVRTSRQPGETGRPGGRRGGRVGGRGMPGGGEGGQGTGGLLSVPPSSCTAAVLTGAASHWAGRSFTHSFPQLLTSILWASPGHLAGCTGIQGDSIPRPLPWRWPLPTARHEASPNNSLRSVQSRHSRHQEAAGGAWWEGSLAGGGS